MPRGHCEGRRPPCRSHGPVIQGAAVSPFPTSRPIWKCPPETHLFNAVEGAMQRHDEPRVLATRDASQVLVGQGVAVDFFATVTWREKHHCPSPDADQPA